ncbi:MAG: hypothetical protein VW619_09370 [Rhodobiaceae bacterium]|jgi:hypothetical protein
METNAYRGRLNGPHETATPGPAVSVSSSLALSRMAPSSAAHHRNWSHQGGLTNNLVMLGLSLTH